MDPIHEEDLDEAREIEEDAIDAWQNTLATGITDGWAPSTLVGGLDEHGLPVFGGAGDPMLEPQASHDHLICLASEDAPRCVHLARVVAEFPAGNLEVKRHKRIIRYCKALAADNELMDITGTGVFACELREPICHPEHGAPGVEAVEAEMREAFAPQGPTKWTPPKEPNG